MSEHPKGFVLVTTLWVLAIATVLVIGLSHRSFLEARASAYSLDHAQARLMAQAAVNRGMIELRNKFYKDLLLAEEGQEPHTDLGQSWAQPMALHAEGGFFEQEEGNELDGVWLEITDAERRINVNAVPDPVLDNIKSLNRGVARAVKKRRTEESHEGDGISYFQAVEELRYLRGVDDEDWFGKDGEPGLRDVLTIWGNAQVNLNTAPREVLACIPGLEQAAIDTIIKYRGDEAIAEEEAVEGEEEGEFAEAAPPSKGNGAVRGFQSVADLEKQTDIRGDSMTAIQQFCSFQSNFFIIRGIATRQGGKVRVECRAVVNSSGEDATLLDWQEVTVGS
jgi:type II secretory pathway component PulK